MTLLQIIRNRRVQNLISNLLLQGSKYLFSFLTFPILWLRLGVESYGILVLSQTLFSISLIMINYSFPILGPKYISIDRDNPKKISQILSLVIGVKFYLFLIINLLFFVFSVFIEPDNRVIYFISLIMLIGEIFSPVIYYQGVEKMKIITLFITLSKVVTFFLLYIFVRSSEDLLLAVIIISSSHVFFNLLFFIMFLYNNPIKFKVPSWFSTKEILADGFSVFLSQVGSTVFSSFNILFLGWFSTTQNVSFYSAADKVVRLFVNFVAPVSITILPQSSKLINENIQLGKNHLKKVFKFGFPFFFLVSLFLLLFPGIILSVINVSSKEVENLIRIISFVPLLVFTNNLLGIQYMINANLKKEFFLSIVYSAIILIFVSIILFLLIDLKGLALSCIISEISIIGFMYYFIKKRS